MLGDDALICSQRLTEWVTNAPELEEEVALANIALDLLGQARLLLARAGHVEGGAAGTRTRWPTCAPRREFRNVALAELPDELDFARAIARLLVFSTWRLALLHRLLGSARPGARRGRRQGRQGAGLPPRLRRPLDGAARRRHRRSRTGGCRPRWTRSGRTSTSCSARPRWSGGWPRPGWRWIPAETRAEVDAVLDEVLAAATLTRPTGPADRHDRRPRRPRGRAHRDARARARRDAEPGPPAPGGAW